MGSSGRIPGAAPSVPEIAGSIPALSIRTTGARGAGSRWPSESPGSGHLSALRCPSCTPVQEVSSACSGGPPVAPEGRRGRGRRGVPPAGAPSGREPRRLHRDVRAAASSGCNRETSPGRRRPADQLRPFSPAGTRSRSLSPSMKLVGAAAAALRRPRVASCLCPMLGVRDCPTRKPGQRGRGRPEGTTRCHERVRRTRLSSGPRRCAG